MDDKDELARESQKNSFWKNDMLMIPIYPTPPLGQDMTQGQFLSGV